MKNDLISVEKRSNLSAFQHEVCQLINISYTNNELCDSVEKALYEVIDMVKNKPQYPQTVVLDVLKQPVQQQFIPTKEIKKSDEIERINNQLGGFDWKKSHAWSKISRTIGNEATLPTLRVIAQDMATKVNIRLGRDEKRRKCVLVKWFNDNWSKLEPMLKMYSISGEQCYCKGTLLN